MGIHWNPYGTYMESIRIHVGSIGNQPQSKWNALEPLWKSMGIPFESNRLSGAALGMH